MSVNIFDMVKGAVSDQIMGQIGGLLGQSDSKKTSTLFDTAAQSILSGMMKKASNPQGAQDIFRAVESHDDGVLDKLGDLLGGGNEKDLMKSGGGVLDTVFGQNQSGILGSIGKFLGIDNSMMGTLMKLVAPIVMGVIGRHVKSKALDAVGLGSLLGEQKGFLSSAMPAGLTSSLGIGDMFGGAADSVKGAASAVTGAAGDASRAVSGAAGDAGRAVSGAAGDAASAGGGLLKMLFPLILLGALVFLGWKFLMPGAENAADMAGKAADGVAGAVSNAGDMAGKAADGVTGALSDAAGSMTDMANIDFGGFDMSGLQSKFTGITDGFQNVTSENASGLATKITDLTGSIDGLGLDKLTGPAQAASQGVIGKFIESITGALGGIGDGGIMGVLKPAVDALIEKLSAFK